jgi:uncharacterized membrane protein YhfC
LAINFFLVLGPIGMIAVGVIALAYWRRRSSAALKYFALGGVFWGIAIAIKLVMDLTITTPLYLSWLPRGQLAALLLLGAYVGLRTGLFECLIPYFGFMARGLRGISLDEAMAVGVGFGAAEAIIIVIPSLAQMLALMLDPSILASLPVDQAQALEAQLSLPTYTVLAAVSERAFVLLVHIFTTLLAFVAASKAKWKPLLGAILFKSALDGPLPLMQTYLGASGLGLLIIEIFVAVMGLIALLGIISQREKYGASPKGTEKD